MDYSQYLAGILVVFGIAAQWLRAAKKFDDLYYVALCAGLAVVAYLAVADYHLPARLLALKALTGIPENVGAILAGTQFTSTMANIATKYGASPSSNAIPVTNSK